MGKFNFSVGRRIGLGFGILIFLTLIAFIYTLYITKTSKEKTDKVVDVYLPSVNELKNFYSQITESRNLLLNWVYSQEDDDPQKDKLKILLDIDYPNLKKRLKKQSGSFAPKEANSLSGIITSTDQLYDVYKKEIMSQLNFFSAYEDGYLILSRQNLAKEDLKDSTDKILIQLNDLITTQTENAEIETKEMVTSFNFLELLVKYLGIVLAVGGLFIAIYTVRSIVNPVAKLKGMLLLMGRGVLPKERIEGRNDEIGEMSDALVGLVDGLKRTTDFAYEVGAGNFDAVYKPLSNEDTLGQALLKMRTDLAENERVLERKVVERTEEVVRQKQEIEEKSVALQDLYKQVTDSIKYALKIQEAILPPDSLVKQLLPQSFVLYKPKDIVSGDFYWINQKNGKVLFAAIDCTGHGVPGAFMSIVGYNLLNHVVVHTDKITPGDVLDALNEGVSQTLHNTEEVAKAKDGMDLSFCSIDYENLELQFAGAYNPLIVIRNNEVIEIKADKFPIGFYVGEERPKFNNHVLKLQKNDTIYIFSDGFADQFGGPLGKKFMVGRFRQLLLEVSKQPIDLQKEVINKAFEDWRRTKEQVDDILIWGVRV
ncbi:MAG: SpoIIE family protein phosphatase [Bacteroidetes bacterium]|nr:SpoIIE family protein phosphatase [Bacteroidota bacterium]